MRRPAWDTRRGGVLSVSPPAGPIASQHHTASLSLPLPLCATACLLACMPACVHPCTGRCIACLRTYATSPRFLHHIFSLQRITNYSTIDAARSRVSLPFHPPRMSPSPFNLTLTSCCFAWSFFLSFPRSVSSHLAWAGIPVPGTLSVTGIAREVVTFTSALRTRIGK